jgi:hypothetical protein
MSLGSAAGALSYPEDMERLRDGRGPRDPKALTEIRYYKDQVTPEEVIQYEETIKLARTSGSLVRLGSPDSKCLVQIPP